MFREHTISFTEADRKLCNLYGKSFVEMECTVDALNPVQDSRTRFHFALQ